MGGLGAAGTGASQQNATESQRPTSVLRFHRWPLRPRADFCKLESLGCFEILVIRLKKGRDHRLKASFKSESACARPRIKPVILQLSLMSVWNFTPKWSAGSRRGSRAPLSEQTLSLCLSLSLSQTLSFKKYSFVFC